jgi:AcrR family transcriptional regulator
MPVRRSRSEQTAAIGARLLDAARRVFTRHGFHASSLDLVAKEAGFTKGVVYSRFRSKADLFLAVLDARIEQRIADVRLVAATVRGPLALATAMGREWDERLRADARWSLLLIEFRLYAARLPAVNRRYAALHERLRRAMAELVEQEAAETGEALAVDADDLIRAALALGTGAVLERAAEGDAFPAHLMEVANRAMLLGLVASSEASPAARPRRRSAS